jgi:hypothetical protein
MISTSRVALYKNDASLLCRPVAQRARSHSGLCVPHDGAGDARTRHDHDVSRRPVQERRVALVQARCSARTLSQRA